MAPILKKGLCCLSLRTCALILGAITLAQNLVSLTVFVVSLERWLSEEEYHHHANHTSHPIDVPPGLPPGLPPGVHADLVANVNLTGLTMAHPALPADGDVDAHLWANPADEDYYYGFEDSEAMESLLDRNSHPLLICTPVVVVLALVWLDFVLVLLGTVAVILLIWGAATRKAVLLLPWLAVELLDAAYELGFFAFMYLSNDVAIAIDLLPILVLPITVYCWLVVYSLYQECKETAERNSSLPLPLSMSALEAGAGGAGAQGGCTVPYGRMAA
ncbi:E3 ubiquitin-protein ligase ubr3 [Frankliniella fusca]|uniref:E3 ubiquitin-protein ligase ubr3 n=1 Tax=Frankliniella fusca TaxID=407009 RepID=A0AAE1LGK8_9NEOP|nr:E3 ubiquitin-protein ligase ubr3 [Frankliniella fusca]